MPYINYSQSKIQIVPPDTQKGSVLKLTESVTEETPNRAVTAEYGLIKLSEISIDELSPEQKLTLLSQLISGDTITDDNIQIVIEELREKIKQLEEQLQDKIAPRIVLLDEIEDVTQTGMHTVTIRTYIDD